MFVTFFQRWCPEPNDFDNGAFFEGYRSCVVSQQEVNVELKKVLSALNKVKTILKKKIVKLKVFLTKI